MRCQVPVRYLLLGLIALFIIAGLAVAAVAQRPRVDPQQPPATAWAGERVQTIEIPQLTEEERARVVSIATGDEQLQRLLDGRQYSITSVGVWRTRSLEKIGGGVILTLADPATLEGDWPTISGSAEEGAWPPYESHLRHWVAEGVQELYVLVDLHRGQVVQIVTGPPKPR
jgi:hypothetical protein